MKHLKAFESSTESYIKKDDDEYRKEVSSAFNRLIDTIEITYDNTIKYKLTRIDLFTKTIFSIQTSVKFTNVIKSDISNSDIMLAKCPSICDAFLIKIPQNINTKEFIYSKFPRFINFYDVLIYESTTNNLVVFVVNPLKKIKTDESN